MRHAANATGALKRLQAPSVFERCMPNRRQCLARKPWGVVWVAILAFIASLQLAHGRDFVRKIQTPVDASTVLSEVPSLTRLFKAPNVQAFILRIGGITILRIKSQKSCYGAACLTVISPSRESGLEAVQLFASDTVYVSDTSNREILGARNLVFGGKNHSCSYAEVAVSQDFLAVLRAFPRLPHCDVGGE